MHHAEIGSVKGTPSTTTAGASKATATIDAVSSLSGQAFQARKQQSLDITRINLLTTNTHWENCPLP